MGSPWCWLAGEAVGGGPEWVPVRLPGRSAQALPVDRDAVEQRAIRAGLLEVRWPESFPFDSEVAMLAATFAKQAGRGVAFSLAAMRQAFNAGRDLSVMDNVLVAAAACELHPRAVLKGIESASVATALAAASERAAALGVSELPALTDGNEVTGGPRLLDSEIFDRVSFIGGYGT